LLTARSAFLSREAGEGDRRQAVEGAAICTIVGGRSADATPLAAAATPHHTPYKPGTPLAPPPHHRELVCQQGLGAAGASARGAGSHRGRSLGAADRADRGRQDAGRLPA